MYLQILHLTGLHVPLENVVTIFFWMEITLCIAYNSDTSVEI